MHLPPYVPKLHSSQIRTSVSGRTYESHTGLFEMSFELENQQDSYRGSLCTIFHHISRKDGRSLRIVSILNSTWTRTTSHSPIPGWRRHIIKSEKDLGYNWIQCKIATYLGDVLTWWWVVKSRAQSRPPLSALNMTGFASQGQLIVAITSFNLVSNRHGGDCKNTSNEAILYIHVHAMNDWEWMHQDKWKLPTPSLIAVRNFSRMTALELYSGSFR